MWRKTGTLVIIFSVSTALVTVFISSPFNKQMLCYAYCSNEQIRTLLSYHHHQPQQQPPSSGFSDDELIPTLLYGSKCIRRLNVLWGAMDDLEKKLITILLSMTLYRKWEFWILRELTPKNIIVKFKWWPLYFFHWSHWFSIPIHNENYQVLNT